MPGFGPEITVTCENHGGPGVGLMTSSGTPARRSGTADHRLHRPDEDVILPLMEDAAYAAESGVELRDCPAS
jgi:branched-chain amino acid transport system substrate-binding protein